MSLRLTAARILSSVAKDGHSLTESLDSGLKSVEDVKDKAFVQALCYGVIRQYHRLDFILDQVLAKSLRNKDNDIKMLLLAGLYQIHYMRVKPHAAVSETVSAVGRKSWAKSLINAVLRQYIREQESLEKRADEIYSVSYSHPKWLLARLKKDWPDQAMQIIRQNNQQAPMVLRVNLMKISVDGYIDLLQENGVNAQVSSYCETAITLEEPVAVEQLPGFTEGMVSVQDTAAQLSVSLLALEQGQTVLDLCAAPGGKTAAILEKVHGQASVFAVDVDASRMEKVKQNLARLGLQANMLVADATEVGDKFDDLKFDRILVDAPCSALGVIRRHPDIKLLRRDKDIDELVNIQQKILQTAWQLLSPGGLLVYATCSVLQVENEKQLASFINSHADSTHLPIKAEWGMAREYGRQILTGDSGMDGFYYARLLKQG